MRHLFLTMEKEGGVATFRYSVFKEHDDPACAGPVSSVWADAARLSLGPPPRIEAAVAGRYPEGGLPSRTERMPGAIVPGDARLR